MGFPLQSRQLCSLEGSYAPPYATNAYAVHSLNGDGPSGNIRQLAIYQKPKNISNCDNYSLLLMEKLH